MKRRRLVRVAGMGMAATFALVGVVFLTIPGDVLAAFNWAGRPFGLPQSPTDAFTLYLALAVAYMYVVTLLAWRMARQPEVRAYAGVLVQAKGASALVCVGLFAVQDQYLVYLVNFAVDGALAAFVWWIALRPAARTRRQGVAGRREGRAVETGSGAAGSAR
jgi:hypothetical protein